MSGPRRPPIAPGGAALSAGGPLAGQARAAPPGPPLLLLLLLLASGGHPVMARPGPVVVGLARAGGRRDVLLA